MFKLSLTLSMLLLAACSKKKESAPEPTDKTPPSKPAADKSVADKPTADKPGAPVGKSGCQYITEADATAALGQPSKYRSNDGESKNCIIDPVDESKPGFSVDFEVKLGDTGSFDDLAKTEEPVPGLGDKAVITKGPAQMLVQVAAVKGKATLMATVSGPKGELKQKAQAFAEKVLSKL